MLLNSTKKSELSISISILVSQKLLTQRSCQFRNNNDENKPNADEPLHCELFGFSKSNVSFSVAMLDGIEMKGGFYSYPFWQLVQYYGTWTGLSAFCLCSARNFNLRFECDSSRMNRNQMEETEGRVARVVESFWLLIWNYNLMQCRLLLISCGEMLKGAVN